MGSKSLCKSILKGLFRAIILTLILIVLLTIVMFFKEISPKTLNIILTIIICFSIVYGSIVATIKNGKNGWLVGLILGGIYFLIIFAFSSILLKNNLMSGGLVFINLIIFTITGMLSGMLAINM